VDFTRNVLVSFIIVIFAQNEDISIAEVLPFLLVLDLSLFPNYWRRLAFLFGCEGIQEKAFFDGSSMEVGIADEICAPDVHFSLLCCSSL
jgi:hypothetical protein